MITAQMTVDTLMLRVESLTQLMDEESTRLTYERPSDLIDLVTQKQKITNEFNHAVQNFLHDKKQIRLVSLESREALMVALQRFDQSVMRNGTLLLKLQRHKQDMLSMIAEELHPGSCTPTSYAPGKVIKHGSQRAPLAINAVV
jgi:flagellar biosynthesis/type III secretory pathway chaperone